MNMPLVSRTEPTSPSRKAVLAIVLGQFCFGLLAMTISIPSMQDWAAQFSVSQATVQLSFSLYVVAFGGLQLVFGPLSDRLGRKAVLLTGLALAVVASFLAALAPSMGWLLVARALQGAEGDRQQKATDEGGKEPTSCEQTADRAGDGTNGCPDHRHQGTRNARVAAARGIRPRPPSRRTRICSPSKIPRAGVPTSPITAMSPTMAKAVGTSSNRWRRRATWSASPSRRISFKPSFKDP
ncbi:MAG: MFS transporter [Rhodobacterales bacterium]|nr:MAG: MFS transporter [Rhodobacterales bacterium]